MLAAAIAPLAASSVSAQSTTTIEAPEPGYSLVWNDEFDSAQLNREKWCTRLAFGGGAPLQVADPDCTGPDGHAGTGDFLKDEQQRYRDINKRNEALHVINSGILTLRATPTNDDDWASFESSLIRSKFEFKPAAGETYYITTRLRLPNAKGSFAAVWLASGFGSNGVLSWPPEIDTLEAALNGVEDTEDMVRIGAYVNGAQTASGSEEEFNIHPDYDTKWNNFYAESSLRNRWLEVTSKWSSEDACTYIDGELIQCERYRWVDTEGAPANAAHIIFNLAVGGEWAGRHGIDKTKPMVFDIDYVRVFKK